MLNARSLAHAAAAIVFSAGAVAHAGDIPQPYGSAAQAQSAQREINIHPTTRHVNVERDEVVRFVTPQGTFAWSFDTDRNRSQFDFAQIAPQSISADGIRVFVSQAASDR
jgi:hypothetical protein